ncbi:non-canonical purine NTP pyrophosphatase, rdgB/HAM1 family [Halobacteroides halobius DSM 5150]|uniref:dITP/XTP pyrophosphatase n=1 Tax=Halobacteroides halobius (strain ATCC 35273 / DSM 5150 / MD-1) TaxID=748449 RepID=L0KBL3_HALHC|nr:XTP/dITP diphosphatase [Halobacteroides halobius]AGB41930.1 non-canonical purine NTP pyrophosphatase, rdgB/HAM1 family [Halobacteroides halobius DSM 5150]
MKLFLATGNEHKIKEMKQMLSNTKIKVLCKDDFAKLPEVIEDKETFKGNALKKARKLCDYLQLPTIADDSGLVVDVLDGQPGVYSARFAGQDASDKENNDKLLKLLEGVKEEKRLAHFTCAMAFVTPEGREEIVIGKSAGKIALAPHGKAGFGYDPLFIPQGYDKSFAQLGSKIKNKISHRANALVKMKQILLEYR